MPNFYIKPKDLSEIERLIAIVGTHPNVADILPEKKYTIGDNVLVAGLEQISKSNKTTKTV